MNGMMVPGIIVLIGNKKERVGEEDE